MSRHSRGEIIRAHNRYTSEGEHDPLYELVDLLGEGGMAEVWKAVDIKNSPDAKAGVYSIVALKLMNDLMIDLAFKELRDKAEEGVHLDETQTVQRFFREIRSLSLINSEHVTKIFAAGIAQGRIPYYACEFLDGQSLSDELFQIAKRRGILDFPIIPEDRPPPLTHPFYPLSDLFRIVDQLLKAFEAFHERGLYHRDVKPDNIMILREDHGQPCAKLLDFGIAKFTERLIKDQREKGREERQLTQEQVGLGTPDFMAPEQYFGGMLNETGQFIPLDASADLFSLAMTMFHAVTGVNPYGKKERDKVHEVLSGPDIDPARYWPGIPEELRHFIMGGLAFKPWNRLYSTASQMRSQLAEIEPTVRGKLNMPSTGPGRGTGLQFDRTVPSEPPPALRARRADQVTQTAVSTGGKRIPGWAIPLIAVFFITSVIVTYVGWYQLVHPDPVQASSESSPQPSAQDAGVVIGPEPGIVPKRSVPEIQSGQQAFSVKPDTAPPDPVVSAKPVSDEAAGASASPAKAKPLDASAKGYFDQGKQFSDIASQAKAQGKTPIVRSMCKKALESFERARERSPDTPSVYIEIARCQEMSGDPGAAYLTRQNAKRLISP